MDEKDLKELEEIINRYSSPDSKISNKVEASKEVSRKYPEEKTQSSPQEIRRNVSKKAPKKSSRKSSRIGNIISNILLTIFILVFLGSGTYLAVYFIQSGRSEKSFDDLKGMIATDKKSVAPEGQDVKEDKTDYITYEEINGVSVQSKFAPLYRKNPDFIGWLSIEGTKIDYPVMFTPEDEEFYLRKNFEKNKSTAGTLFLGIGSDIYTPSDSILIYGHNMKIGTMFHDILSYSEEEFYQKHKYIEFDTIESDNRYEVIAAFKTEINENDPNSFKYYQFYYAADEKDFDEFVSKAKEMTPYNIPVTAEYGDKLITLSTCSYHANEGRYVVVAKKID